MRTRRPTRPRLYAFLLAASGLLPLATACGGETPPVAPQHLDIPAAPVSGSAASSAAPASAAPATATTPAPSAEPAPKDDASHPAAVALPVSESAAKIVAAADRTDADRALDAGRHPGELLTFLGIHPAMNVGELVAGGGYTTELLARAVSPKGKVWAENPPAFLKFVGPAWKERLARPALKNVVRVDRELDAPLPPEAKDLDAVVSVLNYHDMVWTGVDRAKMNKALFDALKKGGEYVIVDHSAAPGHGIDDVKTFHRIEEAVVVKEVTSAGFQAAGSANFLRNPSDARDWNDSPKEAADKRGTSDRFVLKFVKP